VSKSVGLKLKMALNYTVNYKLFCCYIHATATLPPGKEKCVGID